MKKVSNEYKKAMNQIIREQAYISVVLAEVNGIAQNDAQFVSDGTYYSDGSTPFNTNEQITYATFEEDFTLADGKSKILPREGSGIVLDNGYTSENILGSVTIEFGNTYSIKGLTINFGSGYPTEFKITTDVNSEGTVYENDSEEFVTTDTIGDISSLTITPITMVGGNQRLRIKRIIMGIGLSYNNEVVESADLSEEISDISEDIPDTQLKVSVLDMDNKYNVNNADSFIDYLTTGQLVTVSFGVALDEDSTEIEWLQTQTLYLSDWSAKNGKFTFSATNIFAQQNDTYTLGNRIYTRTAYEEAESIFTDLGLETDDYQIDNYLKSITLTNPMPEDTHANCLLLLCNACRCIFFQDGDGVIHIQGNFALNLEPEDITLTTVGETAYSTPRNVLTDGAVMTHYADFTSNFASADGSFKILPRNSADYVSDTGFVSQNIADDNGNFFDNILPLPSESYNEFTIGTRVVNGLTITASANGEYYVNGTATADTYIVPYRGANGDRIAEVGKYYRLVNFGSTLPSGVEFHFNSRTITNGGVSGGTLVVISNLTPQFKDFTPIEKEDWNKSVVFYKIASGTTINACTFKPMLVSLGEEITDYDSVLPVPYYDPQTPTQIPMGTFTRGGVTVNCAEDGTLTLNGKATANFFLVCYRADNGDKIVTEGRNYRLANIGDTLPSGMTLNFNYRTIANANISGVEYPKIDVNTPFYDFIAHGGDTWNKSIVMYYITTNTVFNNLVIKPVLFDLDNYYAIPTNYQGGKKPSLTLELEAGYVYYGLELNFSGQPPQEVVINTTYNGGAVDNITFTDLQAENYLYADFKMFDTLTVTFTKGAPNTRINVDFVGLGNITDYRLDKDNMTSQLVGTREELVKDVQVKIYTYENDSDGNPQEVEDDVWYTETLNSTGSHKEVKNPLISSNALAKDLAEWLGTHYKNNFSYEVDYRGDPRLNAADIIKLEDEYINNLQVSINKASLKFNGAFSGKLDMRRAMRE